MSWKGESVKLGVTGVGALTVLALLLSHCSLATIMLCVVGLAGVAWHVDSWSRPIESLSLRGKAVFITGCDTGIGHALALCLDQQGVVVFAGCLNARSPGALSLTNKASERLQVLQVDVTKMVEIHPAVESIKKQLNQNLVLWGVVNNAGINTDGDIELLRMEDIELVTNVNYLGMVRVTKAFLPLIRSSKGRILNVTSVKGRIATPFCGSYTPTKYAGEAFSDILRLEMAKFGVHVAVIEPGHFGGATGMIDMDRFRRDYSLMWESLPEEAKHVYGEEYIPAHLKLLAGESVTSCFELERVTRAMEHALFSPSPQTRYLIAGGSGPVDYFMLKALLKPLLPDRWMDRILLRDIRAIPNPQQS